MTAPGTIAVEATDAKYAGLKHMPSGQPLGADGKAIWPADQFTFRLIGEAALRESDPAGDAPAVAAAPEPPLGDEPESTKS